MDELYAIMRDMLEIEYNQKSLVYILKAFESAYREEQHEDVRYIVNSAKYYLEALQKELKAAISKMDIYIAQGRQ